MRLMLVAGARPNFMKVAPLIHSLRSRAPSMTWRLIHTGQHYDYEMSKSFFDDLDIPQPDYFLNAGSGSHAEQTARVMQESEKVFMQERPDAVIVVGDVNSTMACSITAKKLGIRVAHIEAGLRSGDMGMPEEINRIVTDAIADLLFITEPSGQAHLLREGKNPRDIIPAGNIMIDNLHYCIRKLGSSGRAHSGERPYAVLTLHRPSNVDTKEQLGDILEAIVEISRKLRVYFPVHPRTRKNIEQFGLMQLLNRGDCVLMPPQGYLEFLVLWKNASCVLTDSGGMQEETTAMGIPCFTLRDNTERPITIEEGTNTLVGTSGEKIRAAMQRFFQGERKKGNVPALWDGKAAERILDALFERISVV